MNKLNTFYFMGGKIVLPQSHGAKSIADFLENKSTLTRAEGEHVYCANLAAIRFGDIYYKSLNNNIYILKDNTGQLELWHDEDTRIIKPRSRSLEDGILLGRAWCVYDISKDKLRLDYHRLSRSKKLIAA